MKENYQTLLASMKQELSKSELECIHYQSVYNFVKHLDEFKRGPLKDQIIMYLDKYFKEVKEKQYLFDKDESMDLFQNCIVKIGTIYYTGLNFKVYMRLKWALFISLNIDLVLLLLGILKKFYYIPIVTVLFCGYISYLYIFYESKNKLYGYKF